jgi:tRNA U34 5-methylaminomethyl-2-thiouridine-forming methyltransferase MnmC
VNSGYDESLRGKKEVIVTEDGSKTLYSKEFDQAYHSTKDGALQESLQKHVIPAFALQKKRDRLTILDICFGLGYNTLATLYYVKLNHLDTKIHILSPEFDRELVESLATFEYPKEFDAFKPIIEALSKNFFYEDEQFKIEVLIGDARESIPKINEKIDIVYQDAFSPKQNPLLWTKEYFKDIRAICSDDAIITTYSTAIATRMGLYENGFEIFLYYGENARRSTIASPKMIEELEHVDMELKKQRNKDARSLKDKDFL